MGRRTPTSFRMMHDATLDATPAAGSFRPCKTSPAPGSAQNPRWRDWLVATTLVARPAA